MFPNPEKSHTGLILFQLDLEICGVPTHRIRKRCLEIRVAMGFSALAMFLQIAIRFGLFVP